MPIRHDLAHVLAEAAQTLWPGTRTAIGPAIERDFYYDFDRDPPFTPEDLPIIEAKMREIVTARTPFARDEWSCEEARAHFQAAGETYKLALLDAIPEGKPVTTHRQGHGLDLCRGSCMRHTGDVRNAFKLTHLAGAYWRGDAKNKRLSRIYGVGFSNKSALDSRLIMMAEAEKRETAGYVEVNSPGIRERALWET